VAVFSFGVYPEVSVPAVVVLLLLLQEKKIKRQKIKNHFMIAFRAY
jgi:hypothetical protein